MTACCIFFTLLLVEQVRHDCTQASLMDQKASTIYKRTRKYFDALTSAHQIITEHVARYAPK